MQVVSGCKILMGLQVSDLVGGPEIGDDVDANQQGIRCIEKNTPIHAVMSSPLSVEIGD